MNYNKLLILLFIFICGCKSYDVSKSSKKIVNKENFTSKGFTLIYNTTLLENKVVNKKIEERSNVIFQKNLKKNTTVKITNIINGKSIISMVGTDSDYPKFYNSVISSRIAKEIDLNKLEPYIEIVEILDDSFFIAGKAKMFEEEKNVANKVPIEDINIDDLNESKVIKSNKSKNSKIKFSYNIKIADFYFHETAKSMVKRVKVESSVENIKVDKLSNTQYRVFTGPFNSISSLQKAFNDISILEFENIEIIKNE